MEHSSNGYHISFFKPTTPQAKANRNMVSWLVAVWFIAIFGFQILLYILGKPTHESSYEIFTESWEQIENNSIKNTDFQKLGYSSLSVLGKTAIKPDEREVLDNAFSWSVYQLTPDSLKQSLVWHIQEFEKIKSEITNISDPDYLVLKHALSARLSPVLNLAPQDVRSTIIPLELTSHNITGITEVTREKLPGIMEKYLTHNQSVLTDTIILGFPFHYFYTAIFLLIFFVGLCLIYCIRTDNIYRKLSIAD